MILMNLFRLTLDSPKISAKLLFRRKTFENSKYLVLFKKLFERIFYKKFFLYKNYLCNLKFKNNKLKLNKNLIFRKNIFIYY